MSDSPPETFGFLNFLKLAVYSYFSFSFVFFFVPVINFQNLDGHYLDIATDIRNWFLELERQILLPARLLIYVYSSVCWFVNFITVSILQHHLVLVSVFFIHILLLVGLLVCTFPGIIDFVFFVFLLFFRFIPRFQLLFVRD